MQQLAASKQLPSSLLLALWDLMEKQVFASASVSVLALHTLHLRCISPFNYTSFNIFDACVLYLRVLSLTVLCVCMCVSVKGIDGGLFAFVAVCRRST